ncbi:MAG: UDP-N-acetylglucosamine diphosphorylase/glucosamine-phosphate N-acetyltransferase [Pseudomonadota bacterium]|jgi:bifunctional UDP-N-acetylglucosamine pyrophosphorylase/glucosamine-1-phosphate N-acetyltransferase
MQKIDVVVLAAGKGTRMYSAKPKVLHELAGRSLVQHTIDTAKALQASGIHVVIGHEADLLRQALASQQVNFALQAQQLGTGHAVHQALPFLAMDAIALVLYGDVPLIRAETLQQLLAPVDANSMAVLTSLVANPHGLGRIVRDAGGNIRAIVEEKDATAAQREIREINTGFMAIPVARMHEWLPRIQNKNAQGEYYLTDIIALALADNCRVHTVQCLDELEAAGVNNRQQLAELERHYQKRETTRLMLAGVTLRDPARVDLRGRMRIAQDVEIDINVVLEGNVDIATGVTIGPNCVLKNCTVGAGSAIAANSVIEDAVIGEHCTIGPFARIRPGTVLEAEAKIGNFVEIKKSRVGKHSKVNHLSYVGDSELGADVNIGAGTITCNYDGVNKAKTIIGDRVFIGSNTALVAPVTVAAGATVGAGSVITKDVGKDQLALARSRQSNIDGWERPTKKPT